MKRRDFLGTLGAVAAVAAAGPVWAKEPLTFQTNGIAIRGYDPVAYFTENGPVEGSADFTALHDGATYRFASAANRDLFVGDPVKYAPKYGGYCAYAVSKGYTASTDPDAWSVHEGRLYLNYSKSVRALWAARRSHHITSADGNWPKVLG